MSARATSARRPIAPIQANGRAAGRNPMSSATPTTTATAIMLWIMLPTT
jgi:hypothetical protein